MPSRNDFYMGIRILFKDGGHLQGFHPSCCMELLEAKSCFQKFSQKFSQGFFQKFSQRQYSNLSENATFPLIEIPKGQNTSKASHASTSKRFASIQSNSEDAQNVQILLSEAIKKWKTYYPTHKMIQKFRMKYNVDQQTIQSELKKLREMDRVFQKVSPNNDNIDASTPPLEARNQLMNKQLKCIFEAFQEQANHDIDLKSKAQLSKLYISIAEKTGFSRSNVYRIINALKRRILKQHVLPEHRIKIEHCVRQMNYTSLTTSMLNELEASTGLLRSQIHSLVNSVIDKYHRSNISDFQKEQVDKYLENQLQNESWDQIDLVNQISAEFGLLQIQAKILLKSFVNRKKRKNPTLQDRMKLESLLLSSRSDPIPADELKNLKSFSRQQIYDICRYARQCAIQVPILPWQWKHIHDIYDRYRKLRLENGRSVSTVNEELVMNRQRSNELSRKMYQEMQHSTNLPKSTLYTAVRRLRSKKPKQISRAKYNLVKQHYHAYKENSLPINNSFYNQVLKEVDLTRNQLQLIVFKLSQSTLSRKLTLEEKEKILNEIRQYLKMKVSRFSRRVFYSHLQSRHSISKMQVYSLVRQCEREELGDVKFTEEQIQNIKTYLENNLTKTTKNIYSELSSMLQVSRIHLYKIVRDLLQNNTATSSTQIDMKQRKWIETFVQENHDTLSTRELYNEIESKTNIPRTKLYWLVRKYRNKMKNEKRDTK